ncbi:hypothetical protein, partial [Rhodococcus opacus]|uniref:hypothetical protein n=1 Tax=Rhodococcus opacus TaxID=37919 RepID=UPI0024B9CEF2
LPHNGIHSDNINESVHSGLVVLFGFYVLAWFARGVPRATLIGLAVIAAFFLPPVHPIAREFVFLAGLLFLGWSCGENSERFERFLCSAAAKWVGLVGFVALAVPATKAAQLSRYDARMLVWSAAAIIGAIVVVRYFDGKLGSLLTPMRYVGRNSLRFYVIHFLLIPPWTMLLIGKLHMTNGTYAIILMGSGILLTAAAASLMTDKVRIFEWLFTMTEFWRTKTRDHQAEKPRSEQNRDRRSATPF